MEGTKKQKKLGAKIVIQVVLMALALILIAVLTSYIVFSRTVDSYYRDLASNLGKTTALQMDPQSVQTIIDVANDPEFLAVAESALAEEDEAMVSDWLVGHGVYDTYLDIRTKLEEIRQSMGVEYLYIQRNEGATSCYLVDPSESILLLGIRAENNPEFAQFLSNEHIEPTISNGEYGWLCSGYEPLYNENGEAIALIGVDISMTDVMRQRQDFLLKIIVFMALDALVTVVSMILLTRKTIIRPINQLSRATREFVDGENGIDAGNIVALDIRSGDEIEDLYTSIQKMELDINSYIDNLAKVTAERERISAELDVATNIQLSVLPCTFPAFPERSSEFDIYATMTPAKEVGGDFYDFFFVDDDHLALVVADVSGKGVPAALFMMISRTLIKSAAQTGLSPKEILEKVNNQLCEGNETGMFVTVWIGIIQISTGLIRCANAGHEFPAIGRLDGSFELFKDRHGFVLAGMEGSRYREYELQLRPGEKIFVYTDGVAEATNAHNELFGTDRMIEALSNTGPLSCIQLLEKLKNSINEFVGEAPQFDDITMLCLEFRDPNVAAEDKT